MQTAVEWIVNKLNTEFIRELPIHRWSEVFHLVDKAKQMEKEQIIKAYNAYYSQEAFIDGEYLKGEQYYNETYVQEKEHLKESTCEYSGLRSVQSYEDPKK